MVVAPWPEFLGSQDPRIRIVPEGEDHPRWDEIKEFIARLGYVLDPWQLDILRVSLMRAGDFWAAFVVACCVPRQNGKNTILEVRELVGAYLLGEKLVIHSAHLADTSKEAFRRLDDVIDANEWLSKDVRHIWRTNGHEAIEFRNGNRIRFRTRTRGGGRGFSGTPVMFDEAMYLPDVSHAAMFPLISAQPDPQIWYMGSAVDQTTMEDGLVFTRVRERALSGEAERLAYFEWSLNIETPDLIERGFDLEALAETNPGLGIRITPDYLRSEYQELDARAHSVERYGVGDWPPTDGSGAQVIPIEVWDSLADDPAAPGARMTDPVCLAVDMTPDRSTSSVVAVGRREDGDASIEVIQHREGTAWVPEYVAERVERNEPVAVMLDEASPAGSFVHALEALGVNVTLVEAREYAKAFGLLLDKIDQRGIRHLGGNDLRNAIKGAVKRPIGDGSYGWGRRNSSVDISPLVAATLALWGYETIGWDGEVEIF